MSAIASSAASPSGSVSASPCAANLYNIPVQQASCAIPYGGNHTDIMTACCKSASVVSYYNDCGLFCLAQDQTVQDLMDCLFDHGAGYSDVFCRGKTTAEANGQATVAASANAHVVATGGTAAQTGSGSSQSSDSAGNGAAGVRVGAVTFVMALAACTLFLSPRL